MFLLPLVTFILGCVCAGCAVSSDYRNRISFMRINHNLEISKLELKHSEVQLETLKNHRERLEQLESLINTITNKGK